MAADLTVQRGPFKGRPHQWFTRQEVERLTGALSDVDPVTLEVWRMQGRTVGAMLAEAQAAVIEAHEALHLIANTTTDRGAREEAQRALGVTAIDGPRRGPEADGSQTPNAGSAIRPGKAGSNTDTRKLCTCDGAGRGPGRACVVKAGGRLGELWRCAEGHEPTPGVPPTTKDKS